MSKFERLLSYLEYDPNNVQLLADAAAAAVDEGRPLQARKLLNRYTNLSPATPKVHGIEGLTAIAEGDFAAAASIFEDLLERHPYDPALKLNLAWARAGLRDFEAAASLLDEEALAVSPSAPTLKIRCLHHLGRLAEALTIGRALVDQYPRNQDLIGALAIVALDANELELAKHYGARAPEQPECLATIGMLRLGEGQLIEAQASFDRALSASPDCARARLGKGLSLLASGETAAASVEIDRAAELFEDHLGAWVAAAWAYFVLGDYKLSRARFERALSIDDTFSEIHGGLAVVDLVEGGLESAERRAEIALRLDRKSLSGALATTLILARRGDMRSAQRVRDAALNEPIGPGGRTLMQMMGRLAAPGATSKATRV
jgi:tetratricopeptide (TPR) repeat protein